MITIREAIVVEGRYDKNTLSQIVDAPILETSGFGVFKDKQQLALLRRVAESRGLIVLTDSDGAGFVIRNYLKSASPAQYLKHAYIPDIYGKEKRKTEMSKEGKIGVEGMKVKVIIDALEKSGVLYSQNEKQQSREITHTDFFEDGVSGGENSSVIRKKLAKELDLPEKISSSSLLKIINSYMTYEEYKQTIEKVTKL